MPHTLGFVGTGTITSAIVTGLHASPDFSSDIVVSPRNADVAAALAGQFERVRIAESNQAVVDGSDVVFLAIRPQIAEQVLAELRFRNDQHVISLIATYSLRRVASLVAPASKIACAVPQPTVAMRAGPTVVFPPDPLAVSLFGTLGLVVEANSESEFRSLFATTAAMAAYFTLLDTLRSWLVRHDVEESRAHEYIASMFKGLSGVPSQSVRSFGELAREFKTKGGLNEQFAKHLADRGVFDACCTALDAILERINIGATLPRDPNSD